MAKVLVVFVVQLSVLIWNNHLVVAFDDLDQWMDFFGDAWGIEEPVEPTRPQPSEVLKKLRMRGVTGNKLFAVNNKHDILTRSNLEDLENLMSYDISSDFQEKNPKVVSKLLGACVTLLQISRVGCEGQPCSAHVSVASSKFQDLIYKVSRVNEQAVTTVIRMLHRTRYAIKLKHGILSLEEEEEEEFKAHKTDALKTCTTAATQLAQEYKNLADIAMEVKRVARSVSLFIATEMKKMYKKRENETITLHAINVYLKYVSKEIDVITRRMENVEYERKRLSNDFMRLLDTNVIGAWHMQGLKIKLNITQTALRRSEFVYNRLLEKLAQLKKRKGESETIASNISLVSNLILDNMGQVLYANRVMKTLMVEMMEFWEHQDKFIREKLAKSCEKSTESGLPIEEIGLYWLVLGKLNVLQYDEMEKVKRELTETLMKQPTVDEKKNIMTSATTKIKDIRDLHEKINTRREPEPKVEQKIMNEALKLVLNQNTSGLSYVNNPGFCYNRGHDLPLPTQKEEEFELKGLDDGEEDDSISDILEF